MLERAKARTFLDAFIRAASTIGGGAGDMSLLREATERLDGLQSLLPAMSKSPAAEVRAIDSVLANVADKEVLVYFEAAGELWLVAIRRGQPRLHTLSRSAESVRRLVDRFLASPDETTTATALGDVLLPPVALPNAGATLYIVTDGSLGRLPFASLRPRGRILVRDYSVSYVPSLNVLAVAEDNATFAYGPSVVLGDPRGDLPAAANEAQEIAARLGVSPLVGLAATRSQLLERAAHARVLHVASHTGLDARGAWLAAADGDVSAAMLVIHGTRPPLAVLATCASAVKEGREMWGSLGAAFLAAGSKSVLASLWSVADADAREFIVRFYDEGGADDSATALARTQRVFIDSGKPASFWAPYVHFGSSPSLSRHPYRSRPMSSAKTLTVGIVAFTFGIVGARLFETAEASSPQQPPPISVTATGNAVTFLSSTPNERFSIVGLDSQPQSAFYSAEGEVQLPTTGAAKFVVYRVTDRSVFFSTGQSTALTVCKPTEACPFPGPCPPPIAGAGCPWKSFSLTDLLGRAR